ncbi:MAG: transcriptional regulator, CdaR family [Actinomycetia bacterium]|nr:transcriptional regulator, CdaR family [Actinomycetes bacterium]
MPAARDADIEVRNELSSLQGLLVLSMLMTERGNEDEIVRLAATSVSSLAHCELLGVYMQDSGWSVTADECEQQSIRDNVAAQLMSLDGATGNLAIGRRPWTFALPLQSIGGHFGYLVLAGENEPPPNERYLLRVLAQQTGNALASARLHARERKAVEDLRTANLTLTEAVAALEHGRAIHARLTYVAASGEGQHGIARAVHELTGCTVAIEDRHGNIRAWAGTEEPSYPKARTAVREQTLERARLAGAPIRVGDQVIAIANPQLDVLGVLVLIDPEVTAGEPEFIALEHGATVLAMELARLRTIAETELRLGRDLVEELLAGIDEEQTVSHAQALGYDLWRPHRVVIAECTSERIDGEAFFNAVRRAARDLGVGSLLASRNGSVVVLSDADGNWEEFRSMLDGGSKPTDVRVGVGSGCDEPSEFPRSYREAQLALHLQESSGAGGQATTFDELGVYRILAEARDLAGVEAFVQSWLGALIDYDTKKGSELVHTLDVYLEHGGNYDASARALNTHRNTLKYRLQRIREISSRDLNNADTQFNLQLATRALRTLDALRTRS